MLFNNIQKVYRSQKVSGNSFLSSEITLVEIVSDNQKLRLFLYYTGLDSYYLKILEIPEFVLMEENCKSFEDAKQFLNKNNIFVEKWDETNIQYKFESNILIEKDFRPKINSIFGDRLKPNLNSSFSSIRNFEHIKLFDNTDVSIKVLFYEEEKNEFLSSIAINGEFILLRNNHSNVLGAIIVSKNNNLLVFIEKTSVINCLVVDPKKQKKMGEGRIISLSLQNTTFNIVLEEKEIISNIPKEFDYIIPSFTI